MRYIHWAGIAAAAVLSALSAFLLPISPVNDSFSMTLGLQQLLNDGSLSPGFNRSYFAFYANNKVALVLYWGFVSLLRDVEVGIRVLHFLCLFSTAFFFSAAIGKIFGGKWRGFGLFFCLLLFPHIILTSPYVYPIGIALSAAAIYLAIAKKRALKPLLFLVVGLLFLIRPAAAVFIFVFFAFLALKHFIGREKRAGLYALCTIAALFASVFLLQFAVGTIFYRTGFHPYPNLTNGATNWTLDIGTRFDGGHTGASVYTPFGPLPEHLREDEIAIMQQRLFAYFHANNPEDYERVVALNREIRTAITDRAIATFSENPAYLLEFYAVKAARLFGASNYRFYFYSLNVTNPSFAFEAHRNFEQDSETHIMALILLFAASFSFIAVRAGIRRRFDIENMFALAKLTSCAAVVFIMLSLTEVGQRSLLDIFIPAALAAGAALIFLLESPKIKGKIPSRKFAAMAGGVLLGIGLLSSLLVFSANNVTALRSMEVTQVQEGDNLRVEIKLPQDPGHEYSFVYDGQERPLTRDTVLETTAGTWIFLRTPERNFRIKTTDVWR